MSFVHSSKRRGLRIGAFLLLSACWALSARAQFVAFSVGGLLSQDLSSETPQGQIGGPARSQFDNGGMYAIEAGFPLLPFVGGAVHYSHSRPELSLSRGDAFGSSARAELPTHTLTFDARLRTPELAGVRLYGLAGVGFSRFSLEVKQAVEVPFPAGAPDRVVSPVFTYGGGVQKSLLPGVGIKLEVRDYWTAASEDLFRPGGGWHRVAVMVGVVLGR